MILRGIKIKTALFTMRMSFSGRAAHRDTLSQGQETFLESHVYAFDRLGVSIEQIRYDNLKPAVSRCSSAVPGSSPTGWVAVSRITASTASIAAHEGSHERGTVEGEGGRFRRK